MMTRPAIALGAILSVLAAPVFAEGYLGINYVSLSQDDRFYGDDSFETGELMVRLGGQISDYWIIELRAGSTITPQEEAGVEFTHDLFYGALSRFQKPFGSVVPYFALGFSRVEESVTGSGFSGESSFTDTSVALGADLRMGDSLGLNIEYFQLSDEENISRHGPSVGVFYSF